VAVASAAGTRRGSGTHPWSPKQSSQSPKARRHEFVTVSGRWAVLRGRAAGLATGSTRDGADHHRVGPTGHQGREGDYYGFPVKSTIDAILAGTDIFRP